MSDKDKLEFEIKDTGLYEKNIDTLFAFVHSNGEKEGLVGGDFVFKSHRGPFIFSNAENHVLDEFYKATKTIGEITGQTIKIVTFKKVSEEVIWPVKK